MVNRVGSCARPGRGRTPHPCGELRGHTVRVPRWLSSNFRTLRRSTATIPIGPSPDLYKKSSLPRRAILFLRTQTGGVTPPACSRGAGGKCISSSRFSGCLTIFLLIAAIKPRVFERDCGWPRKHLQYRDTVRSENAWRQIVFKVENADEFGLVGSVANRQTGGRWC